MHRTKIVDRSDQIHLGVDRADLTGQMARPPRQGRTAFPEGRIQPLDARRTGHLAPWRALQHPGNPFALPDQRATPRPPDGPLAHCDHLNQHQSRPAPHARATALPPALRRPKHALGRRPIVAQAIGHQQQPFDRHGAALNQGHQRGDQRLIAARTHDPTQPQMGRGDDRHRHPDDHALEFDPHLVGLNVLGVTGLQHVVLMDAFGVGSRLRDPAAHRAAVEIDLPAGRQEAASMAAIGQPWLTRATTRLIVSGAVRVWASGVPVRSVKVR